MVVVVLGLIAAQALASFFSGFDCGGSPDSALVQMKNLGDALALYAIKYERLPSTEEGLAALTHPPGGRALFIKIPEDPWARPYRYGAPGPDGAAYELRSDGPDQIPDTEDDLVVLGSRFHEP